MAELAELASPSSDDGAPGVRLGSRLIARRWIRPGAIGVTLPSTARLSFGL